MKVDAGIGHQLDRIPDAVRVAEESGYDGVRIAFYGSTPAYRGVLESIGAGELQGELNVLSKQGRWQEMGNLISDDVLDAFAVVGEPHEIAAEMLSRYGSFTDRTSASFPVSDDAERRAIIETLRAG